MNIVTSEWTAQAEAAIRSLRDIEGVSIQADGGEIREVHVLTTSTRPAKQIVRDVQTLLLTRFDHTIDHRIVSIAYADAKPAAPAAPAPAPAPPRPATADRVRFVSANLFVSGPRVQAQVELKWRGMLKMGNASGWSTRDGADRLVASATIAALQEFLDEGQALGFEGLSIARVGRNEVAVVSLDLIAHRDHKNLVGSCAIEQDRQQAIVLATLAALNRVMGGLPTRPTSRHATGPTST